MDYKYVYVEIRIYVLLSRISTCLYHVFVSRIHVSVFWTYFSTYLARTLEGLRVNLGALWGFVAALFVFDVSRV